MPTLAYLRVSKDTQDVTHQRLAMLEFARRERLTVDECLEVSVSSKLERRCPQCEAGSTRRGVHGVL